MIYWQNGFSDDIFFYQIHSNVDIDVICQVRSRGILMRGTTAYHTPQNYGTLTKMKYCFPICVGTEYWVSTVQALIWAQTANTVWLIGTENRIRQLWLQRYGTREVYSTTLKATDYIQNAQRRHGHYLSVSTIAVHECHISIGYVNLYMFNTWRGNIFLLPFKI